MLQNAHWIELVVLERMEKQRKLPILMRARQREKIRRSDDGRNFRNAGKVA
jgi:hypothetical protein